MKWLLILMLVLLSGWYAAGINVREDAMNLLPDDVLTTDMQLFQQLGMVNRVYFHLRLKDADSVADKDAAWQNLRDSVIAIAAMLEQEPVFTEVIARMDDGYEMAFMQQIRQRLPILLDDGNFEAIRTMISDQGLKKKMSEIFLTLNTPAGIGLKQQIVSDPLGLSLLAANKFRNARGEFAVTLRDGLFTSKDGTSCLLWADSGVTLTDSEQAFRVQEVVDRILEQGLRPGVEADIIGALPHTLANLKTVNQDLKILLPLATLCLAIFLFFTLKGFKSFLVLATPFLASPPAIALLRYTHHEVSALALGFGIVLLGLAVDFAVHIYLALSLEQGNPKTILKQLQRPLFMAWMTTCGVFVILLFSSVASHRQMALLAIGGVTFAVLISVILIPTFAAADNSPAPDTKGLPAPTPPRHRLLPILCWLLLIGAGFASWPQLRYNGDLQTLDATSPEIDRADADFHKTWREDSEQAFILAVGRDLDEALNINDRVFRFLEHRLEQKPYSIAPILPGPEVREERLARWHRFWEDRLDDLTERLNSTAADIGFAPGSFAPFLHTLAEPPPIPDETRMLTGLFRPMLSPMVRLLPQTDDPTQQKAVVLTIAPLTPKTWSTLQELKRSVPGVSLLSTMQWREKVEHHLRSDITRLSSSAGLFIVLLTFLFFRRFRPVLAALAPVGSALAAMAVFDFCAGQDLNLMHALMGLMVIGLSVDYGIFSVCAQEKTISHVTRKAISICAVSTCIGFGILALAAHPALHALGVTVLVGIGFAWPTALWVSPAILYGGRHDA